MRSKPDFLDESVRTKDRVRKLELKSHPTSTEPGPWVDLMDYINTTYWIPGTNSPEIRSWAGWAETRGRIVCIDDLPSDNLLAFALPTEYWPDELADVFLPVDDDADMDLQPPRGGWSVDVLTNGFINFDSPEVVIDRTTGSPTLKYTSTLFGNFGRPMAGCALTFEGVRWSVDPH